MTFQSVKTSCGRKFHSSLHSVMTGTMVSCIMTSNLLRKSYVVTFDMCCRFKEKSSRFNSIMRKDWPERYVDSFMSWSFSFHTSFIAVFNVILIKICSTYSLCALWITMPQIPFKTYRFADGRQTTWLGILEPTGDHTSCLAFHDPVDIKRVCWLGILWINTDEDLIVW